MRSPRLLIPLSQFKICSTHIYLDKFDDSHIFRRPKIKALVFLAAHAFIFSINPYQAYSAGFEARFTLGLITPRMKVKAMKLSLRIGEVCLTEMIARGSLGEVWRGAHHRFGYPLALKCLPSTDEDSATKRQEFAHEIQLLTELSHPGIISVYDTRTLDGIPVLAMELADHACSHFGLIRSWSSLKGLLLQVLQTLRYLHARQITHCDLKPANILQFCRSARPATYKLIDFGLAQHPQTLPPGRAGARRTYQGSPAYSAPEQFLGETHRIGPWTDLYALGSTAYELASGSPPFGRADFVPLAQRHLNEIPAPIRPRFELPAPFNDWLQRLLQKDPRQRFPDADSAIRALLSIPASAGSTGITPAESSARIK